MMKLFIEDIDMHDYNQRKEYLNNKLRNCETTKDFVDLNDEMRELGFGDSFYTKRGSEINCIWTNKERNYYCDYPYGEPIKHNGKDAVVYNTVKNSATHIVPINSLYKYWVIH